MTIKKYAFLNEHNIVKNVILIDDSSDESLFNAIADTYSSTKWLDVNIYGDTEINGEFDGNRLWKVRPFSSWVKGEKDWVPPIPVPDDGKFYIWNEEILNWEEVSE